MGWGLTMLVRHCMAALSGDLDVLLDHDLVLFIVLEVVVVLVCDARLGGAVVVCRHEGCVYGCVGMCVVVVVGASVCVAVVQVLV